MHKPMRDRVILMLCAASLVGAATAARAADVAIPGTATVVKPGNLAKLIAKSATAVTLPAPTSSTDPTLGGAELRFFDTVLGGAGNVSFTLDASGWRGLGQPAGAGGYKYKGKDDVTGGACASVILKPNVIKAVCRGATVTLAPPFVSTEGVILGLPAGTAALRYCAELGGTEKKNEAALMKRVDALPPAACPQPPPTGFDANDVAVLAADALQGRNNNTPGSLTAQQYLIGELKQMGAAGLDGAQSGDAAFKQPFVQNGQIGTNILAVIAGSDLPAEYIVVGGHYDHLGSCRSVQSGDTVCNGATDNAAGVAAVLGVGRGVAALPTRPRRSVVLALWDAEEDGLLGSLYYVNHPIVPIANTVGYVNFDIQGANLLPSLRNFTFAVGPETGAGLGALVSQATSGSSLDLRQLSYLFGQGRSDYVNFVNAGVPTVFFSDSTGPCYHTNGDEVSVVDFAKLEQQTRTAYELTVALADAITPPAFTGAEPGLATYADAVTIDAVLTAGLADLGLFSPADQTQLTQLQSQIHTLVTDGAANFDANDVITLLLDTISIVDVLTRTPCDGFL